MGRQPRRFGDDRPAGRMAQAGRIAARVASFGLPSAEVADPIEVPEWLWPRLLARVTRERITGPAVHATRAGFLFLSPEQADLLSERHREALSIVAQLEHLLDRVHRSMEAAAVRHVVLKGAAAAHVYYPSPSWRCYGDLDLLVPAQQWDTARSVLHELGFRRILPEPRPGFDEAFGKGATHEDAAGLQVDLHRTLALGPFGLWLDPDALLRSSTELRIRDLRLERLDDDDSFLHACIHAALGREAPLLLPLRDVAQIATSGRVAWAETADLVRRWRLAAPVAQAIAEAEATLGVRLEGADPLRSLPTSRIERRALAAYTTDRARRGGPSLAALWAIPGVRRRIAYLRAMVLPRDEFLRARREHSMGRRLWIPLRWVRRWFGRARRPRVGKLSSPGGPGGPPATRPR